MIQHTVCATLLLLVLHVSTAWATHARGGTLEYRSLGGAMYEATITTYTKISPPSNQADRTSLQIDWGDGSSLVTLPRDTFYLVAPDVQRNVYKGTHTYLNQGTYTLSTKDPNRNDGILNINGGNSVGQAFYVEATLLVGAAPMVNNSVRHAAFPIFEAELGQTFQYHIGGYDPDGDIVCYDLVTPKEDRNNNVMGYQSVTDVSPGANNTLTLDNQTGMLTWNAPQQLGSYVLAVRAREYRNGVLMGTTVVDFQVTVVSGASNHTWIGPNAWPTTGGGVYEYTLAPATSFELSVAYEESNANVFLAAYSEALTMNTARAANISTGSGNKDSLVFEWRPTTADVRCAPYLLTLRGNSIFSGSGRLYNDLVVKLYVRDGSLTGCDSILRCERYNSVRQLNEPTAFDVVLSPNPFQKTCLFQLQTKTPNQGAHLVIVNALGRRVFETKFYGQEYAYESENLAPGLYFYTLELDDGRFVAGKLLKQ